MDKPQIKNLLQQRRYVEAKEACVRLCEQWPQDAEAWFLLGAIHGQLGNFPDAERSCRAALRLQPTQSVLHYNLAIALINQQKTEDAIQHLRDAIRFNPEYAEAHADLGNVLQILGRHKEALACYDQAIHYKPEVAATYFNAGNANREIQQWDKAITCYQRAIELQPDFVAAYTELGRLLIRQYRLQDAIVLSGKALARHPDAVEIHFNLGIAYQEHGEADKALACYQRVLGIDPGHEGARANIAGILGFQGKYEEARTLLLPLLHRSNPDLTAVITYGNFAHRFNAEDDAISRIDDALRRDNLSTDTRVKLHFAIAKILDRRNQYEAAFEHYRRGNELKRTNYSMEPFTRVIEALKAVYGKDTIGQLPRSTNQSSQPVFIVGMPRSGTSLVEQILASHPAVFGAGELHAINDLVFELPKIIGSDRPYPFCVTSADQAILDGISRRYLDELDTRSGGGWERVTDKMPNNFVHLGLIDILFPGARVIHCLRDAMDTCLSCYFHNFGGEHAYAYDLENLGTYYRQYQRLMAHWRGVIRIPMLEVRYEDMVKNPEQTSRTLIEFCGLPWDYHCLRFYETQRTVATASYDQVRRPIYDSSVGRWKHYESFLAPLKSALGLPQ